MTLEPAVWMADLVRDFPGLRPEYDKWVKPPRPFAAMVLNNSVRWLEETWEAGDQETPRAFISRVDAAYPSLDERWQGFVLNFVQHLPGADEIGSGMAQALGPELSEEYRRSHQGTSVGVWIDGLVRDFPGLEPLYADHMGFYEELLSSLLLSEIVRWLAAQYQAGDYATVRALMARVDADYPNLNLIAREVVRDSFVDMMPSPNEPGAEMVEWLSPTLRQAYPRSRTSPGA